MSQLGDSSDHPQPVIEPSNGGAASVDLTTHALHVRIRQLGVLALQGKSFIDLLNITARLTAEGMEAEFKYAFSNRNQGIFTSAWSDRTQILRSYLCAMTASGTLTSVRARDWEWGSSSHLQNNCARTGGE